MVGHIPEPLAKVICPLLKSWKILEIKAKVSGEKRAAPEGTWVLGGGIEIPAVFYVYGAKCHKRLARKALQEADAKQL